MKINKKFASLFLSAAFLFCSATQIAAEELNSQTPSSSASVTAKYSAGTTTDVYSVDIQWGSMAFEYKDATREWDPEKHEYTTQTEASWDCAKGANEVTVTNHSSKPVTVELAYTPAETFGDIEGTFTEGDTPITSKTLEAASGGSTPNFTATLNLSGTLPSTVTEITTIGNATVTLKTDAKGGADNGVMNTTNEAGYVRLYSKVEWDDYEYTSKIYKQNETTYMAEIYTDTIMTDDETSPDTLIYIGNELYYIFEEGDGFEFKPSKTVNISTDFYNDGYQNARKKITRISPNTTYRLTITLNGDGTGTATLEEITA